jgi:hypothetical protein
MAGPAGAASTTSTGAEDRRLVVALLCGIQPKAMPTPVELRGAEG